MYINLPKMNFDIFNNIRIFLMYKYKDVIHKTPYFVNSQIINLYNKLNKICKYNTIYNLFNLEFFIDQIALKFNTQTVNYIKQLPIHCIIIIVNVYIIIFFKMYL